MAAAREKADSSKPTGVITKATSRITLQMAMENTSILVGINIRVSGRAMFPMAKAKLSILMKASIMDASSTIENTEREFLCRRDVYSKEISSTINWKELAACRVTTVNHILGNGMRIRSMGKGSILGRMVANTKVNTDLTSGKDKGL